MCSVAEHPYNRTPINVEKDPCVKFTFTNAIISCKVLKIDRNTSGRIIWFSFFIIDPALHECSGGKTNCCSSLYFFPRLHTIHSCWLESAVARYIRGASLLRQSSLVFLRPMRLDRTVQTQDEEIRHLKRKIDDLWKDLTYFKAVAENNRHLADRAWYAEEDAKYWKTGTTQNLVAELCGRDGRYCSESGI